MTGCWYGVDEPRDEQTVDVARAFTSIHGEEHAQLAGSLAQGLVAWPARGKARTSIGSLP